MSALFVAFLLVFGIILLVTVIEYLTGAERQGLKSLFFLVVAFLLIYWLFSSLKASGEAGSFFSNLRETLSQLGL